MTTDLMALTEQGMRQFSEYLVELDKNPKLEAPRLSDFQSYKPSRLRLGNITVEQKEFSDKKDFVEYIYPIVKDIPNVESEEELWSWLGLFYFNQVCPKRENGTRRVREDYYLIMDNSNSRHQIKHLLNGPFLLYNRHGDISRSLLTGPLNQRGYYIDQIVGNQLIVTCEAIMGALDILYFDKNTFSLKKEPNPIGFAGKGSEREPAPGTHRRFKRYIMQVQLNYDFYAMTPWEVLDILPSEFDEFKP